MAEDISKFLLVSTLGYPSARQQVLALSYAEDSDRPETLGISPLFQTRPDFEPIKGSPLFLAPCGRCAIITECSSRTRVESDPVPFRLRGWPTPQRETANAGAKKALPKGPAHV